MMKRRVFVALAIPGELASEILSWEKNHLIPARWLSAKNLHITLVPPWYEENIEEIASVLDGYAGFGSPKINFYKVSYGPDPKRPRLIWAEAEDSGTTRELKSDLEISFGIEAERRPWKTHLTLARFREEDFESFKTKNLDEPVTWKFEANKLVLMESHLKPSGAEYEIIHEVSL